MSSNTGTESSGAPMDGVTTWDAIRRIADEIELKAHLAKMDTRDRWRELLPRVEAMERRVMEAGHEVCAVAAKELEAIWHVMQGIRDDVAIESSSRAPEGVDRHS